MSPDLLILIASVACIPLTAILAVVIKPYLKPIKHPGFNLNRYLITITLSITVLLFAAIYDVRYFVAYLLFTPVGMIIEYCLGFAYHQTMGQRLWTYNHYNINRYTSYLVMPVWGLGGLIILSLMRMNVV